MKKETVRARILEIGLIPVIRASSAEEAVFAVEAVCRGGIPIVEITMTVPGAVKVIAQVLRQTKGVMVGAGTVLNAKSARQCVDAGAQFLVSPGFSKKTVDFARKNGILMLAGAMTPTEVITAWEAGSDFVKVFPCAQVGGASYIKALKGPLPQIPLVPTGGVNLDTAAQFIAAGAAALGVGGELLQKDAMQSRNGEAICSLAQQFVQLVKAARSRMSPAT
jgi:2-dehydro-3-deoxyphosphogluconate aldolase / (4S)-4-hydroxy-2-oxoglutarate aldolase